METLLKARFPDIDIKKIHNRLIYLLENWRVEAAIGLAVEAWGLIKPTEASDLLRCLVGAEENLPMSEDQLFELRKIALDLADEYRKNQLSQLSQLLPEEDNHDRRA